MVRTFNLHLFLDGPHAVMYKLCMVLDFHGLSSVQDHQVVPCPRDSHTDEGKDPELSESVLDPQLQNTHGRMSGASVCTCVSTEVHVL